MTTQSHHLARRAGRSFVAALACAALASCSDSITPPGGTNVATLAVVSRDPHPGIAGHPAADSVVVRAVDANGGGVAGAIVRFSVTGGGGSITPLSISTDAQGYATAEWVLGDAGAQSATARVDGAATAELHGRIIAASAAARPMLGAVRDVIHASIQHLTGLLPNNPQSASYMEARIALLRTPGLGGDILDGGRYVEGSFASRSGSPVPVTAVFVTEAMRAEAAASVDYAEAVLPVLESFLAAPFPSQSVRLWHGFILGNNGGGGSLNMEDRATYLARTPATRLPYDAILVHELAHSYVGNESLTQFLELYGHNVLQTGSAELAAWTYTRGWVPGREANDGVHALLDVYQLIGPAAMANAYRALLPSYPPYGQPLSPAVQQAFVDAAPPAAKTQVAAKVARVVF